MHNSHEFVQPAWPPSKDTVPSTSIPALNGKALNGKRKNDGAHQDKPGLSKNPPGLKSSSNLANSTATKPKQPQKPKPIHRHQTPAPQKPRTNGLADGVATKIRNQLAKDGIKPPQWPANPGSITQRKAVEKFREAYSAYREKAMRSLIRAGLFDDPDKKRRLSEAINFKGICEEMCPDWDKVTRIVQHDVKKEEKEEIDGELVASLPLMVTRYSRSSAGQDLPLPMDVRSPAALRRTLNYLISELIPSDDLLPIRHHFLWDRTRAIRREFTFQGAAMSREEKKDFLYCLETITRFHVTALHLLSQPDFAPESFSEQQEIEQLSKTLISLMEAYEDCAKEGILCENEAEFRGYYIVFNAGDPALMEKIQSWEPRILQSDGIKTATCLAQSLQNTWTETGPLVPRAGTEMALCMAAMFFSIVASPQISYTMACFAEVHFGTARHAMLQTILNGYQRPKNGPKDLTPAFLKERLHFETEEDAIRFVELHEFKFREDDGKKYMVLPPSSRQRRVPKVRVPHSHSYDIVERKRGDHSLPDVIYDTIWDEGPDEPDHDEDSLFVHDSQNAAFDDGNIEAESDVESVCTTVTPTPPEVGKLVSSSLISPPSSLFASASKLNGLSPALSTGTQGIQSRDFASQMNGLGTSASPPPKLAGNIFSQGLGMNKPQESPAFSAVRSAEKTSEPSNTSSSTTNNLTNFLNKNNAAPAPSAPSTTDLFSLVPANSPNKVASSASIFSNPASASSTGSLFPTSLGALGTLGELVPTTGPLAPLGNAPLKPKEPTPPSTSGPWAQTRKLINTNNYTPVGADYVLTILYSSRINSFL